MYRTSRFRSRAPGFVLALVLVLALIAGCAPAAVQPAAPAGGEAAAAPAAGGKVIKIGVLAPLTGTAAADGEEMLRGAQLAAKDLNAAGGVDGYTFEVVSGDTKDQNPDAVLTALEKLASDPDVKAMTTGYASTTNFEIENMAQMKMPYIISANAVQTQDIIAKDPSKYGTVWSLVPSYEAYETELPRLLEEWAKAGYITLSNRKVAIVTSDNPYSKTISDGLKENFPKYGWTVTVDETVPFGDVLDWRPILAKIRQDPPDLIVNTDYLVANEVAFMEQFLEDPTDSLMFMQYGPSVPEFVELTADSSTGVLYNLLGGMILSPKNELATSFMEKFKAEYGVDTGSYGYALYESVMMYADALKEVGNPDDREAIGAAIGAMKRDTATGHIEFDPATHLALQGDDYIPIQFYQLRDGERILLHPPAFATGTVEPPPWLGQ